MVSAWRMHKEQVWIWWRFMHTDRVARITGRACVQLHCRICNVVKKDSFKVPRFKRIDEPEPDYRHQVLQTFIDAHQHQTERGVEVENDLQV